MKAVSTKFHGPTDRKGSRISADDGDGNRVTVSADHSTKSGAERHWDAAAALCRKMGWTGTLVAGATKDGYVFVFTDEGRDTFTVGGAK